MLTEPDVGTLLLLIKLMTPRPTEKPELRLPTSIPAVTDTWPLLITPPPTSASMAVSDAHVVASHAVRPILDVALYAPSPMPAP